MNEDKTKIYLGNFYGYKDGYDGAVFSAKGIAPTLKANMGGCVYIVTDVNKKSVVKKNLTTDKE